MSRVEGLTDPPIPTRAAFCPGLACV
jgi:hypothetical protein